MRLGMYCTYDVCTEGEGRLRGFGTDKGREEVQNPENLADVICTCPLSRYSSVKDMALVCCMHFRWIAEGASCTQHVVPHRFTELQGDPSRL